MTTIAVRLAPALVQEIDHLVVEGQYASRSEAIRGAIGLLLRTHEEIAADQAIGESYRRTPQSDEEASIARAATRALIEEEPW